MSVLRLRCYLFFFCGPHMDWVYISIHHLSILGIFELLFFFNGFSSATCANFFRSTREKTFNVINEWNLSMGFLRKFFLAFLLQAKDIFMPMMLAQFHWRQGPKIYTSSLVTILWMHHNFLPRRLLCQLGSRLHNGIVVLMCRTFLAWFGVCDLRKHFCKVHVLVYLPWKDILFQ